MRARADLSLMLVTDAAMMARRGVVETVVAAVAGGVTIVQLRDKAASDADLIDAARALRAALAPLAVPLIVNDRPAVARAAGTDGVHIGQNDGDPAAARAIVGPDAIVGLSVTGAQDLASVNPAAVDYVGLGPVFPSATKTDATPPLGIDRFHTLTVQMAVPVLAIGGIDTGNAAAVIAAGSAGIAVVSAIAAADDPRAAAAALRMAMRVR
jgi:thiamine-phosphate pyrophosphorylase